MQPLFETNGLMFWTHREIQLRNHFKDMVSMGVQDILCAQNPAWDFTQIEAPQLTPRTLINQNYTEKDVWVQEQSTSTETELVLRPETTPSSYVYAKHVLSNHSGLKPPFVVWQAGKSFRREHEQVTKNMRLKEFYQQEFQCFYTADTKNDYQAAVSEPMRRLIAELVGLPARIVESDRLPSYSKKTMDIEVDNGDKWMEICSISVRTDFDMPARFVAKGKTIEKELDVLEIAVGLDRMVYNYNCYMQGIDA